jgi:hypothetical protein
MSRSALLFLVAALASLVAMTLSPPGMPWVSPTLGIVAGSFALLFVLALVRGRRFKFDPLLR